MEIIAAGEVDVIHCSNCGALNDTSFKFCADCGHPLQDGQINTPQLYNSDQSGKPSDNSQSLTNSTQKPSTLLIIGTVVAVLLNGTALFLRGTQNETDNAYLAGYVIGGTFFLPLVIVAISCIWKQMRNLRSALKVFLITTIVLLILTIINNILVAAGNAA